MAMTHDELMLKINWIIGVHKELPPSVNDSLKALRAVVELHTPWDFTYPNAGKISYCGGCPNDFENGHPEWPCDTIQVIEKELV